MINNLRGDLPAKLGIDYNSLERFNPRIVCACILYTSDAADDLLCVDLGGRRINQKKIHPTH